MDIIWIVVAFIFGLSLKQLGLPPLIGYLIAGFALNFYGIEPDPSLDNLANLGITLMLFTVGLKLNIKDLLKSEVWAGSLSYMLLWMIVGIAFFSLLAAISLTYFTDLDVMTIALIAFSLSFSSTVCVVKLLEEAGELRTRHGKIAIGVLIMQDIIAVMFLVAATGQVPSIWAIGLLGLLAFKPILNKLLDHSGHGELLPLMGFFLALGGYELFKLVGIKGDLGALIIGIILATHPKASELAKSLLGFKDLFLIGFFLSIGFSALPTLDMLIISLVFALLIPVKFIVFSVIFNRFRLRGRSSYLASLALSNYSEFGLIVAAISVKAGWLANDWLVILALSVSMSFVITSIIYRKAHTIYVDNKELIKRFEHPTPLSEDIIHQPESANILVIGMGRVGKGAYKSLCNMVDDKVWGMDADNIRIDQLQAKGLSVFCGDGEDIDMWEKLDLSKLKLVLIALPSIEDQLNIVDQLKRANYQGKTAAIARFEDDRNVLLSQGIDRVFNFYTEAGTGFAEESLELISTSN